MGEVAGRQAFPTNGRVTNEIPLHLTVTLRSLPRVPGGGGGRVGTCVHARVYGLFTVGRQACACADWRAAQRGGLGAVAVTLHPSNKKNDSRSGPPEVILNRPTPSLRCRRCSGGPGLRRAATPAASKLLINAPLGRGCARVVAPSWREGEGHNGCMPHPRIFCWPFPTQNKQGRGAVNGVGGPCLHTPLTSGATLTRTRTRARSTLGLGGRGWEQEGGGGYYGRQYNHSASEPPPSSLSSPPRTVAD
jgi:hypothetical protein